jgi:hypothetical protein
MAEITGEGLTFEKVWAAIQETGRILKESLKASGEETDRRLREASRIVGDLGNKFGKLSEYLVVPNMVEKFNALGYVFTKACRSIEFRGPDKNILTEIDILLENGEFALVVEVKSDLTEDHVARHVQRMEKLRRYWDDHNDRRKLLGAVAGAIMEARVKLRALEAGFYVIVQSGDTVKIDVRKGFHARNVAGEYGKRAARRFMVKDTIRLL